MCIFYSCQFALGLFLFKNVGPSSGTKRRAGNMASMSGADDTEFKKTIETSIVPKIRTVMEINVCMFYSCQFPLQLFYSKLLEQVVAPKTVLEI